MLFRSHARRLAATLTLASSLALAGSAVEPPSDYAKTKPPKIPLPPAFAQMNGFGSEQLEPYNDVLTSAERNALVRGSQAIFASEAGAAIKRFAAYVAADRKKYDGPRGEFHEEGELFSYSMPNDPSITLGTAKSYDGAVTAPPRLKRDAFNLKAAPEKPGNGTSGGVDFEDQFDEDEWIYQNPAQVCSGNLSYSLMGNASMFRDLEMLPPPAGIDVHALDMLLGVEQNPNPILHSFDEVADADTGGPGKDTEMQNVPPPGRGGKHRGAPGAEGDGVVDDDSPDLHVELPPKEGEVKDTPQDPAVTGSGLHVSRRMGGRASIASGVPPKGQDAPDEAGGPDSGPDEGMDDLADGDGPGYRDNAPLPSTMIPYAPAKPVKGAEEEVGLLRPAPGQDVAFADLVGRGKAALHGEEPFGERLMAELLGIGPTLAGFKQQCLDDKGVWAEAKAGAADETTLFACKVDGKPTGLSAHLILAGADYPEGVNVTYDDPETGLTVEMRFGMDREAAELGARRGTDAFGPLLLWDAYGNPSAMDFHVPEALKSKGLEYDVYEWHEDGAVKLVGHRKNGEPAGVERTWYASGALDGEVDFDDKGAIVQYREWYENHRPAEDTHLENSKMQGVRKWWHESGTLAGEANYQRGEPEGPLSLYYEDGTKGVGITFKGGRLDGDVLWAFDDGTPLYQGKYKDGKPEGLHKLMMRGGNTLSERRYKAGQADGTWVSFDVTGKPVRELTFRNGVKDGKAVLRYKDGQTFVDLSFKSGQLDGPLNSFFPGGQLAATCLYDRDLLAQFTRFFPTGETALEGKVTDGEKGTVSFATLRRDGSTAIECTMTHFQTQKCKVYDDQGQELAVPSERQLAKSLKASPPPADAPEAEKTYVWKPDQCGGYTAHLNYDAIINGQGDQITATYETNKECADHTYGESLSCTLSVVGGKVRPGDCQVGGWSDTENDLQEIISEIDGKPASGGAIEDTAH